MKVILSIRELTVDFIVRSGSVSALDSVSLDLYEGETLALVGESGCGKSTLAKSIIRLLPSNSVVRRGSIILHLGEEPLDLLRLSEEEMCRIRGNVISMIFQEPSKVLSPVHKVEKQITDHVVRVGSGRRPGPLRLTSSDREEAIKRAIQLLRVGRIPAPEKILERYPHELSGGMKQRVVITASLMKNPKIVLADEPTTALDVTVQAQILRLFNELKRRFHTTILFITHNLAVAAEVADRAAVMYAGQLVEVCNIEELFENPLHPYTAGLIQAIPKPHIDHEIKPIPGTVPDLSNPPPGCRFHPRCPHASGECTMRKPELSEAMPGHWVACYRLGGSVP